MGKYTICSRRLSKNVSESFGIHLGEQQTLCRGMSCCPTPWSNQLIFNLPALAAAAKPVGGREKSTICVISLLAPAQEGGRFGKDKCATSDSQRSFQLPSIVDIVGVGDSGELGGLLTLVEEDSG